MSFSVFVMAHDDDNDANRSVEVVGMEGRVC